MSDDNTTEMLEKLRQQLSRLPEGYQSPVFSLGVNRGMPETVPVEFRMMQQPEMRLRRSIETPLGYFGMSVGSEQGEPAAKLEYAKQLAALGGLLDVSANVGKGAKGASVTYQPEGLPVSVTGSMSQNQFGQIIRSLQAQYAQELMRNLMLGIYGQAGTNPMVGLKLERGF